MKGICRWREIWKYNNWFIYLFTYLFIYLLIYLFILFIYLFIYLFTYLLDQRHNKYRLLFIAWLFCDNADF